MPDRTLPTRPLVVAALAILALGAVATAAAATPIAQPADDQSAQPLAVAPPDNDSGSIEDEFVVPAPEEGDEYFEAVAADRRWISYVNPRDEYRDPYLGEGSGKICVTLRNQDGDVVAGESVPDTTVEIPTGETLSWHSEADPIEVEFPLTKHYERPLDSDQFGTSSDVPQGDGYMDSHCIELHGPDENATISYGEARVDGEHADRIDVVGYVQKTSTWDTDVDPIAAAEPYEDAGGWTYEPGASHGQAVVVLQLDPPEDADDEPDGNGQKNESNGSDGSTDGEDGTEDESGTDAEDDGTGSEDETDAGNQTDGGTGADGDESDGEDGTGSTDGEDAETRDDVDSLPGFGVELALAALSIAVLARTRR